MSHQGFKTVHKSDKNESESKSMKSGKKRTLFEVVTSKSDIDKKKKYKVK